MAGRPKKQENEKRKHAITCRLTDEELQKVENSRGGMTPGEWIRRAALGLEIPNQIPELNKQAWAELSKVASNLNQLARQYNQYGAVNSPSELARILGELRLALLKGVDSLKGETP